MPLAIAIVCHGALVFFKEDIWYASLVELMGKIERVRA
jgi:hypothetical protein